MPTSESNYDVTTNEIMDFLKENMVTKREFREELAKYATKEDLERFATKEELRAEIGKLRSDITDILDEKIMDLRGDIVALMRKGDHKLVFLVEKLAERHVLTPEDVREILTKEPFPKLMVS